MESLRQQMFFLASQLKLISDQLIVIQSQLEEDKKDEKKAVAQPVQKVEEFSIPQTESWDDDDHPSFMLNSGHSACAVKRIVRRAQSMCPACRKVGGCCDH